MKMSFFIRKKSDTKTKRSTSIKRNASQTQNEPPKKKKNLKINSEEIDSDIESDEDAGKEEEVTSSSEEEETAEEKKLRLAKQYLTQIRAEEDTDEDEETSRDVISNRLRQDLLEQAGKLWKEVANTYVPPEAADVTMLRGHQLSVTCLVITPDDKHVFTGSKDCAIIKWNVSSGKRVQTIPGGRKGTEKKHIGHTAHVLCMAISTDGKYLVSGDRNKLIYVWNPDTCARIHMFTGHRDAVSALAFRKGTHQLFSASHDRSIKIWSLDEMAYVETLFGHQDVITDIDCLTRERAISTGGRDHSVRIWKVVEESQLIYHCHLSSVDCVSLINEDHFITGADDNSISLWGIMKKKPLLTIHNAHSGDKNSQPSTQTENWITSVRSLQSTDLIATGSKDGHIRFWQCSKGFRTLNSIFSVPVNGFVNDLKFSSDGLTLIAGIGQEHKLGRWWRLKEAKNGIAIIKLRKKIADNT